MNKEVFTMIGNDRRNGSTHPWNKGNDGTVGPMFFRGFLGETRGVWPVECDHPEYRNVVRIPPEVDMALCEWGKTSQPVVQVTPVIESTT